MQRKSDMEARVSDLKVQPATAEPAIAVLIPCYNEEVAIGKVVRDFRAKLPNAAIFVYDNNSKDRTLEAAAAAGAICRKEPRQGKGNVVRRMFADIQADVYVLVDGDDTYDAASVDRLIAPILREHVDMVNATREASEKQAYRPGHRFGNRMLTGVVKTIFGNACTDVLSGYRAMSRRFVKSFPALSQGFEIEVELTIHAMELGVPIAEITAPYKERPVGSTSKLNTIGDGIRILSVIIVLMKEEQPLKFFGILGAFVFAVAMLLAFPLAVTYLETGLVPRLPTAVLVIGLTIISLLLLMSGLILDTVTRGRQEAKRMHYLSLPARQDDVP